MGQSFLKTKLSELDEFKSDPNFWRFGFGQGGPYHKWLVSVNEKRDAHDFTIEERIEVAELQQMGLDYIRSRGRETEYTKAARGQILEVIESDK